MPDVRFDTYYRYDDLTKLLHRYTEEYPDLVRLESIGRSWEGRDIWVAAVTNEASGPDVDKPAFWVDGNIHANEVSGSSACLYLIDYLAKRYAHDDEVTRCLDTRAFYVCPRVGPDGAELYLSDRPRFLRSSTRPYPHQDEDGEGLVMEDMDGDGRMLTMRIPDGNGHWKICPEEPRLLVERDPAETGGEYFRLLWEGRIEGWDGALIRRKRHTERLDLNRNFPVSWRGEHEQPGAGRFPASEPEVASVVRFIASRPNVIGGLAFHTWGGVLLRPYGDRGDDAFPEDDLRTYEKIGRKAAEITGYSAPSGSMRWFQDPAEPMTGLFKDWMYEMQGGFGWIVELWNPYEKAGIEDFRYGTWFRDHPLEHEIKLLRWSDEALGGRGYVDWYPFEHPQLGKVELGGWDWQHMISNPPPQMLEREIAPFAPWLTWHLLVSPRLEILDARAEPLQGDVYRVRLVVQNSGWLPTYVTKRALEKKLVRGVVCEITLPEGASLANGAAKQELSQLEGRAYKPSFLGTSMGMDPTDDRAKAEWVVRAPAGGTVRLVARHERAGKAQVELLLGAEHRGGKRGSPR